jgi:hypothetical protein
LDEPSQRDRRRRLAEAVRQARAIAGKDAVLRVLDADSESRVPERRSMLTPFTTYTDDSSASPPGSSG